MDLYQSDFPIGTIGIKYRIHLEKVFNLINIEEQLNWKTKPQDSMLRRFLLSLNKLFIN